MTNTIVGTRQQLREARARLVYLNAQLTEAKQQQADLEIKNDQLEKVVELTEKAVNADNVDQLREAIEGAAKLIAALKEQA